LRKKKKEKIPVEFYSMRLTKLNHKNWTINTTPNPDRNLEYDMIYVEKSIFPEYSGIFGGVHPLNKIQYIAFIHYIPLSDSTDF